MDLKMKFLYIFLLFLASTVANAEVRLPGIFTDNMVLQRDKPISVWGWAAADENIKVALGMSTASTKAGKDGRWTLKLPAMNAGGPYTLTIEAKNKISLSNILVGDLWLCGGQSNMQWTMEQTGYKFPDTSFISNLKIRLFTVYVDTDYMPRDDVKGSGWKTLSLANISHFSAVGFHFGRYLAGDLQVPIGLISDNLGATSVETWMSNEALMKFPQFRSVIEEDVKRGKNFKQLSEEFEKMKPGWYSKYYFKGIGIDEHWYDPAIDVSDWKPIDASGNTWEHEPDLKDHDGEVWFRTTFDLSKEELDKDLYIPLSQIDDYDIAWVNGTRVGESYGKHNHHGYNVKKEILKEKDNILVIRVFDVGGIGGFTTSPFWTGTIMKGKWIYKKGSSIDASTFPRPVVPNATPFSSPTTLYNGSIAPLHNLPIKGVIWYQGEANADRAYEYRELFPAMINDWRRTWQTDDLPFIYVQLANYGAESPQPAESTWAELREAQQMTARLKSTSMITAIDIGEANDIHPKNKLEVGRRLGLAALGVAYQKNVIASGPTFQKFIVNDDHVTISFDNTGGGLIVKDKYGYINGFQVAGEDHKFYWAKAVLDGNNVIVTSDKVTKPIAVRYAWDNNPGTLNLYNTTGLPAYPFRTDQWDGVTAGKVFIDGPRF